MQRYRFINQVLSESVRQTDVNGITISDKIDSVLTNRIFAIPIFLLIMWLVFQATFIVGAYPVVWIELGVGMLGKEMSAVLPAGLFQDLIVNGIISGVGSVLVFLPNILILFLGISFLEDTGYMARAAFIMDRVLQTIGLQGKSFIPLLFGFGCNVPAILAARSIENRNDRILTILLTPLISCSAWLPVYVVLAGAFFTNQAGNLIFCLYLTGMGLTILLGRLFKKTLFQHSNSYFMLEMPPYRLPTMRSTFIHMWE